MLEIEDSKLGRIKFINVTECRTHISKIMTDTSCNYVITKNNAPIRVIINYDVFQSIQEGEKAKSVKVSDSKALLKGLIEVTEKELKIQAAKRQRERVIDPGVLDPTTLGSTLMDVPGRKSDEISPSELTETSLADDLLGAPPTALLDDVEEAPPQSRQVTAEPTPVEPAPAEPTPAESVPTMSKEEADYFERFKKLYDSTPFDPSGPRVHDHRSSSPKSVAVSPTAMPPVAVTGIPPVMGSIKNPSDASSRYYKDPPSIQDLLKDLDQERLSQENKDQVGSTPAGPTDDLNELLQRLSRKK